jgi:hypothetical protein
MLGLQAQVTSLFPCTHEQSRRPRNLRDTAKASVTAAQPNNIRLTHCSGPQTPHSCRISTFSTSTAPIDIGAHDMQMYFQTHAASVQILTRKCTVHSHFEGNIHFTVCGNYRGDVTFPTEMAHGAETALHSALQL